MEAGASASRHGLLANAIGVALMLWARLWARSSFFQRPIEVYEPRRAQDAVEHVDDAGPPMTRVTGA